MIKMGTSSLKSKAFWTVMGLVCTSAAIGLVAVERLGAAKSLNQRLLTEVVPRIEQGAQLRDLLRKLAISELQQNQKELADQMESFDQIWGSAYAEATSRRKETLKRVKEKYSEWSHGVGLAQKRDLQSILMKELQTTVAQLAIADKRYLEEEAERVEYEMVRAYSILIGVSSIFIILGALFAFRSMGQLSTTLTSLMDRLRSNFEGLDNAADRLSKSSQALSGGEESGVQLMDMMVKKNVESAREASHISIQSEQTAKKGKEVVDEMIRAIKDIDLANNKIVDQVNHTSREIGRVVQVISEIGEKTKVINDIVLQTKILSFNASVEASKAGEHGKGFAVVAEEVRSLTQMSGKAAQDISELIQSSIREVQEILRDSQSKVERFVMEGTAKVDIGSEVAVQCGQALDEIVTHVATLNKMALSIANASHDQEREIRAIVSVAGDLDLLGSEVFDSARGLKRAVMDLTRVVSGRAQITKQELDQLQDRVGSGKIEPITKSEGKRAA